MRVRSRWRAPARRLDLSDPAVARDPFPVYEALRRDGDVHFLAQHDFWIVLGYDAVTSALESPAVFSSEPYEDVDAVLLAADPPAHAPVRRLIARIFGGGAALRLSEFATRRARELLAPELEVVDGYAARISRDVGAELIGVDAATLAAIVASLQESSGRTSRFATLDELADRASLYPWLIEEGCSDAHARSLLRLLWLASTTTTERAIPHCVLRLLEDQSMCEAIRGDRALLPRFLEEVLRLHPAEHIMGRRTTEAARLGGVDLPAGAEVQLCISAANRDPARFDDPAELRLDRPQQGHLSFGAGVHRCIGAGLGRRVLEAAVGVLLDASDDLRPVEPLDEIPYFQTPAVLTLERLVVRL